MAEPKEDIMITAAGKYRIGVHRYWSEKGFTSGSVDASNVEELCEALEEFGPVLFWLEEFNIYGEESRTPVSAPRHATEFDPKDFEWLIEAVRTVDRYVAFRP